MFKFYLCYFAPLISIVLCGSAYAVDGVILIDQNRALAGNVTPGDAPGLPVTLSLPGSYRLSGNLTIPAGISAIEVTANGVTIDLNGFSIIGASGSGTGITTPLFIGSPVNHETTVLNGTVRNMGGSGVVIGDRSRVENVRAISNGFGGIFVGGGSVVRNNIASGHQIGITVGCPSSVVGNTASGNNIDFVIPVGCTRDQNSPAP